MLRDCFIFFFLFVIGIGIVTSAIRVPRARLRVGVMATDDTVQRTGHVHGGVLYMSNLVSVLASFDDVDVFILAQSCARPNASDPTVVHRRELFEQTSATRVDLDDDRYEFVVKIRDNEFRGRICRSVAAKDRFQARVLPLFVGVLGLDVLLIRSQQLLAANASRPWVRMPSVMHLFSASTSDLFGRAWIVYMNSFLDSNASARARLNEWVKKRNYRVLFQEPGRAEFAESALGDSFRSSVVWAPSIAPIRSIDDMRAKVHPRGSRPLTVCYFGSVNANRYLNNDLVLGFAAARKRLPLGQLRMILIETTPLLRSLPLTPKLLQDVDYRAGPIPHTDALELYRTQCDLGVRGNEQRHSGGLATKLIEMAAFGIPTIVNPVPVNIDVYGAAYPYYWSYENSTEAITALLVRAVNDADEFDSAARRAVRAVAPYTFDALRARMAPWIDAGASRRRSRRDCDRRAAQRSQGGGHRRRDAAARRRVCHRHHSLGPARGERDERRSVRRAAPRAAALAHRVAPAEPCARGANRAHRRRARSAPARHSPQFVLALGDVTTTVATARAGRRVGAVVVHYEGGLRCDDPNMPEEINRREADALSDVVMTTEESANANLAREPAMRGKAVSYVGNVMIDTIVANRKRAESACNDSVLARFGAARRAFVLVTVHRQANVNDPFPLAQVVDVLDACIDAGFKLLFAAHPRTLDRLASSPSLRARVNALARDNQLTIMQALPYLTFLGLMDAAGAVLTDSGGVQEETSFLGVPCVTLRNATERPSTLTHGTNALAPIAEPYAVVRALREQMRRWPRSANAAAPTIPLWDGRASERIADWFFNEVQ
jgi:UDP-N-acetylglucosamine 2-epimerase (non-hydrolysing)